MGGGGPGLPRRGPGHRPEAVRRAPPVPRRELRAGDPGPRGARAERARGSHHPLRGVRRPLPRRPRLHARRDVPPRRALLREGERRLRARHQRAPRGGEEGDRGGARPAGGAAQELRAVHPALPDAHHPVPRLQVRGRHLLPARLLPRRDGAGRRGPGRVPGAHRAVPAEPVRRRGVGAARRLALRRGGGRLAEARGRGVHADVRLPAALALRPRDLQARLDLLPDGRLRARGAVVHPPARPLRRHRGEDRRSPRRRRLARGDPVHRHQLLRRDLGRRGPGEGLLPGDRPAPVRGGGLRAPRRRLLRPDQVRASGRGLPAGARPRAPRARGPEDPGEDRPRLVPRPAVRSRGEGARAPREDLLRGDDLVGAEQGRPGAPRDRARARREEPPPRRELPPPAGPDLQAGGEARGRGGGVPRRLGRLRRLPRPLPALEAGVRALLQLRRLPLQRPGVRRRGARLRGGARRPGGRQVRVRGVPLRPHLLGGRDRPAAARGRARGPQGPALHRPAREGRRRGRAAALRLRPPRARLRHPRDPLPGPRQGGADLRTRPRRSSTSTATSTRRAAASRRSSRGGRPPRSRSSRRTSSSSPTSR